MFNFSHVLFQLGRDTKRKNRNKAEKNTSPCSPSSSTFVGSSFSCVSWGESWSHLWHVAPEEVLVKKVPLKSTPEILFLHSVKDKGIITVKLSVWSLHTEKASLCCNSPGLSTTMVFLTSSRLLVNLIENCYNVHQNVTKALRNSTVFPSLVGVHSVAPGTLGHSIWVSAVVLCSTQIQKFLQHISCSSVATQHSDEHGYIPESWSKTYSFFILARIFKFYEGLPQSKVQIGKYFMRQQMSHKFRRCATFGKTLVEIHQVLRPARTAWSQDVFLSFFFRQWKRVDCADCDIWDISLFTYTILRYQWFTLQPMLQDGVRLIIETMFVWGILIPWLAGFPRNCFAVGGSPECNALHSLLTLCQKQIPCIGAVQVRKAVRQHPPMSEFNYPSTWGQHSIPISTWGP